MSRKRGTRRATNRRSPIWAKVLVGLGAVLMAASIGTVTYIKVMLNKVNNAVATECLLADCDAHQPGEDIKGPLNLLLIGSDMRKDWVSAQSDSIMILHVNKDLTAANIISIPRDLYVQIPDCGPGWGNNSCKEKINTAFAAGGLDMAKAMQNLAQTLMDRTGLKSFDGAAMINFGGFADLVELFGGVELCVPFDMTLAHPQGTKVKKGCKEYDAEIALGIVRERYAYDPTTPGWKEEYGIGDYGRQRMQQHFIKQLLKKAKEQGYITDPFKVGTLIEKIGDQIRVDLKGRTPVDLAFALKGIDATKITTLKVPSEPAMIGDTSYVVIQPGEQEKAAEELFTALQNDTLEDWAVTHPKWVNKTG
ncbi:transcriptional regulator [Actinorhabdospora filicis]|uniref:Transcriptional regulator n=1 Tax=Actinorhabdospora filicis TaxID=1785913 RepID=A0A9W6SID1_9ACTN|nr:LCP family protein [Actinorhabdospora filicis]GLZ76382.1 transcriptional regulator [Actinorhabdospora filicis]